MTLPVWTINRRGSWYELTCPRKDCQARFYLRATTLKLHKHPAMPCPLCFKAANLKEKE